MTYRAHPVHTYETELGCKVVSQQQTTAAGLLIENVALIGPRELYEVDSVDCGAVAESSGIGDGQAVTVTDRAN